MHVCEACSSSSDILKLKKVSALQALVINYGKCDLEACHQLLIPRL